MEGVRLDYLSAKEVQYFELFFIELIVFLTESVGKISTKLVVYLTFY